MVKLEPGQIDVLTALQILHAITAPEAQPILKAASAEIEHLRAQVEQLRIQLENSNDEQK